MSALAQVDRWPVSSVAVAVAVGPHVLRTETAGLAAVAALQARWGDF